MQDLFTGFYLIPARIVSLHRLPGTSLPTSIHLPFLVTLEVWSRSAPCLSGYYWPLATRFPCAISISYSEGHILTSSLRCKFRECSHFTIHCMTDVSNDFIETYCSLNTRLCCNIFPAAIEIGHHPLRITQQICPHGRKWSSEMIRHHVRVSISIEEVTRVHIYDW